jgi:metal-responsive CopG/Arc/MetJ family transcriptional regulator
MKTAVSVPDEVFDEAERLAKYLKISRSELYSKALAEFASRHAPDTVTESFNRTCVAVQGEPDPVFQRAARKVLQSSQW